jgi:hypothetical protein
MFHSELPRHQISAKYTTINPRYALDCNSVAELKAPLGVAQVRVPALLYESVPWIFFGTARIRNILPLFTRCALIYAIGMSISDDILSRIIEPE